MRYLALPMPRRQQWVAVVACLALIAIRAVALVGDTGELALAEVAVVATWLVLAMGLAGGGRAAAVAVVAAAVILHVPLGFIAAATLLHHVVTLVAWVALVPPRRRPAAAALTVLALATAAAVAAVGPSLAAATGGDHFGGLSLDAAREVLFPAVGADLGRSLVVGLAFLQAVHYATWLSWIPQAIERRSLRGDLGRLGVGLVAAGLVAVAVAASVDLLWTRAAYLSLATFHIHLEVVLLAARGARRWS